ncbi:hypothetical protein HDU92_000973 [Lobulomyces angularis]|nr:hypothetical protein HDU92_000973 [Lobulomyces angularis]
MPSDVKKVPRKTKPIACNRCKIKKKKCDGYNACSECIRNGTEDQCIYEPRKIKELPLNSNSSPPHISSSMLQPTVSSNPSQKNSKISKSINSSQLKNKKNLKTVKRIQTVDKNSNSLKEKSQDNHSDENCAKSSEYVNKKNRKFDNNENVDFNDYSNSAFKFDFDNNNLCNLTPNNISLGNGSQTANRAFLNSDNLNFVQTTHHYRLSNFISTSPPDNTTLNFQFLGNKKVDDMYNDTTENKNMIKRKKPDDATFNFESMNNFESDLNYSFQDDNCIKSNQYLNSSNLSFLVNSNLEENNPRKKTFSDTSSETSRLCINQLLSPYKFATSPKLINSTNLMNHEIENQLITNNSNLRNNNSNSNGIVLSPTNSLINAVSPNFSATFAPSTPTDLSSLTASFPTQGLFFSPIDNPTNPHTFIQEFSTDEELTHFINEDIPIQPTLETEKAILQLKNQNVTEELVTYFILRGGLAKGSLLAFVEHQQKKLAKVFKKLPPSKYPTSDQRYYEELGNSIVYFKECLNEYKGSHALKPYNFYHDQGRFALSSRHPLLFSEKYGGNPQAAAHYFHKKAIKEFYLLDPKERDGDNLDYLDFKMETAFFYFCYGDRETAMFWLGEAYKKALYWDWDKPNDSSGDVLFEKDYLLKKKQRMVFWARFICLTTFVSYPFIGDERELSHLTDESGWAKLALLTDGQGFVGATPITVLTQICFLVRRAIRYENSVLYLGIPAQIHLDLLIWHENVNPKLKTFDSLADFLHGVKKTEVGLELGVSSMKIYIWFGIIFVNFVNKFLHCMIKIHQKNHQFYPQFKFSFKIGSKLEASSLEFILCSIRALSSILTLTIPIRVVTEIKGADYKRFSLNPNMIVYISSILRDATLVSIDCVERNEGCFSIPEIKKEVLKINMEIFLKVLQKLDTPFSKSCLKIVQAKVENAIGVMEINEIYK